MRFPGWWWNFGLCFAAGAGFSFAMEKLSSQVVVVGGGPCGLISALLLARFGVKTILFEKHPGVSRHPKAMGVTRRTGEIYRQLGLLDKMLAGGLRQPADFVSIWARGGMAGELLGASPFAPENTRFSPCHPFHCPQPHTEEVLLEAVRAEPLVDCRFGTAVKSFSQDGGGVRVEFAGADGSGGVAEAEYLVAADGDRSPLRTQLGIERKGPGELGRFLSVFFRMPCGERLAGRRALLTNTLGADFFGCFVTVDGGDLWLMHHFLDEGEKAEDIGVEQAAGLVRRASGMGDVPLEILSLSPWVMSPSVAAEWRRGRVFLVGDAAARVSPAGGLGMNNGVQSAHNLAWKLAEVLHGRAGGALLDSYQEERLAAAKFTFENSGGNAEEVFGIVGAAMSGEWEAAKALIANSRRSGSGYGQDFGIVYNSAAVEPDGSAEQRPADAVNDYIPQGRPGHRAPHVWIERNGLRLSTLDLFGGGYVALCAPGADLGRAGVWRNGVDVRVEGRDFDDAGGHWREVYGVGPKGAVLVRPDGYIAARAG